MLNNDKVMLIFGLDKEEKEILSEIIHGQNLPEYKVIEAAMASMKIKNILEGMKFEIYGEVLPEEKAILFNNFTDDELHKAITVVREGFKIKPILAVITPTSIEWTFKYLLEHLIEEREWHRVNSKRGI